MDASFWPKDNPQVNLHLHFPTTTNQTGTTTMNNRDETTERTYPGRAKGLTGLPRGDVPHFKTLIRLVPESMEKIEQIRQEHQKNTGETLSLAVIVGFTPFPRTVELRVISFVQ
ncbi:MAG: hypothetical protein KME34_19950, partial [Candidatus Thiodiazotropha sp. (ex Codakia orbicularis)]|nr:hypothetical protein [Candidatus Thiodiazotropha sp. (ex Codakia orbicularis)]